MLDPPRLINRPSPQTSQKNILATREIGLILELNPISIRLSANVVNVRVTLMFRLATEAIAPRTEYLPPPAATRAIILTNYRRPWNMPQLVCSSKASCDAVDVLLVDNSDDPGGSNLPDLCTDGVKIVRTGRNMGNGHRFSIAASLNHEAVMCIDDDLLLSPAQIGALFERFEHEPDRVHGVWGEDVVAGLGNVRFKTHLCRKNCEVDVLNRMYVFSPAQARQALALSQSVGFSDWSEIGPTDDIFMSFAGARKPACHDVGPLEDCPSSNEAGIATWRRTGFYEKRASLIRRLWTLRKAPGVHPASLYRAH